jgi:hypothetical protein
MADTITLDTDIPVKRKRGRPTKKELAAKSPGGRGKVGRPAGDASIINGYKARMLASPDSQAVMDTVMRVAMDDEHKHFTACAKMIMDRIAPMSFFEKDKLSQGISGVSITINQASPGEIAIDGEVVENGG